MSQCLIAQCNSSNTETSLNIVILVNGILQQFNKLVLKGTKVLKVEYAMGHVSQIDSVLVRRARNVSQNMSTGWRMGGSAKSTGLRDGQGVHLS